VQRDVDTSDRYSTEAICHYNLHDEEGTAQEDIYRLYANMREHCPVSYSDQNDGHYTVADYQNIRTGLQDWQTFSSAKGIMTPRFNAQLTLIEMDPPDAKFWRNLIQRDLTEKAVQKYEQSIREDVDLLIDGFIDKGSCDLVKDLAEQLPVLVVGTVIGARNRGPELRALTLETTASQADPDRIAELAAEFHKIISEEIGLRMENPRDDFLTRLGHTEVDGKPLPFTELLYFIQVLLLAGNTTTVSALSALMKHALGDPELCATLMADETKLDAAIDESLRITPPLLHFARTTTREVAVGDQTIPADTSVVYVYASGNMDPDEFPNPEEFRLDRPANRHLSFGYGIHRCVGAHLAKLEIRIAMQQIFRRLPNVKSDLPISDIVARVHGGNEMKIASLPVHF
jgi:cytochrome P450